MARTKRKNNISYLCVDDEPDIQSTLRRLGGASHIRIDLRRPVADWTGEVAAIHKAMTSNGYTGLLIDFRLDETHQGKQTKTDGMIVRYTAESLVSELRRRSVEGGKDESYPIVLWSTAKFLKTFYELNPGYVATYDAIWDKERLVKDVDRYGNKLSSLSRDYGRLGLSLRKGKAAMAELLNTDEGSVIVEFDQFSQKRAQGNSYAFQYALFILHDVLEVPGPLIDSATLRAYFGVDNWPGKSWDRALALLGEPVKYDGIFAQAYPRFWGHKAVEAIEAITGASSWLSLPADERVVLLKAHLRRCPLKPAKPMAKDYSTDYDCVCAVTRRPLAKRNGFRLLDSRPLPWKEPEYVAGITYRLRFSELSKTSPLDAEEKERFAVQFGI
jgi:hypothetical protein